MAAEESDVSLRQSHSPDAVQQRLERPARAQYLADAVLGAIDGCVTTFAVVSGVVGAGFSTTVGIVLGLSNLVADGFSMAVSNYEAAKANQERIDQLHSMEQQHIERIPEGEREEIRQIYARKGFSGEVLSAVVDTITSDRKLWIETMLVEEHGVIKAANSPVGAACATFGAFVVVGFVPLLPLLDPTQATAVSYLFSALLAALMFFSIGGIKSWHLGQPVLSGGAKPLLSGGSAAALAFIVGYLLRQVFDVGGALV
ncbi:MAG: VIT1/CCC1 transporter family protein [Pseudomonadales bacterium]